jgi:hypothetical protein
MDFQKPLSIVRVHAMLTRCFWWSTWARNDETATTSSNAIDSERWAVEWFWTRSIGIRVHECRRVWDTSGGGMYIMYNVSDRNEKFAKQVRKTRISELFTGNRRTSSIRACV